MALNEYRKKRNFRKTAEPAGKAASSDGVLHFVVQEHHASHLHYDFRLEHQGVLKSWAVPKGVPDDPSVKRLAVEVEDHPLEYRHFHGTIPKGNYGAGTVAIWDKGRYWVDENLDRKGNEQKIEEELRKGHLSFHLEGKKLHGHYTLVRMRKAEGRKNQWLLIKKDWEEGPAPAPKEALSDAPKAPMPSSVKPMLATLTDKPFDRKGWGFEVKWDGYRILAEIKKHKVRLYTRNDQTYTQHFQDAADELKKLPDMLLDGEMVVVDEAGISRFQLLQNYMRRPEGRLLYYVFDIIHYKGRDLHKLPLSRRKGILKSAVPNGTFVRISEHIEERGKAFFKSAKDNGLEGVIAKDLGSTYQFGHRGLDWLKVKAIQEQEAVICGFTAPRGGRHHFGALILGLYKGKTLTYVGHTGGGFDDALLKDVHARLRPLIVAKCPFEKKPATNAPPTWVKPVLLCAVKFQEWTNDGHMRQPIFLGMREDKKATEAHQEIPAPVEETVPAAARHLPKLKAHLTNLDKVFWPKEGYTKGDMIKYYQDMGAYILPYLKGRAHSLHRQPNGIDDAGFFQKDINFTPPPWLKTFSLKASSRGSIVHHLVCTGKDSLAFMNNLGCIEINPWCSVAADYDHPDFLVMDFDPVEVDFPTVVDVVLESRKILLKAGCDGFCKTSGSRGIHVYIPLKRKYTYAQVKDFAHVLCMAINRALPEITSLERSPGKRHGLVYLDYLQNHVTATMAAPYSLRPRPGAPVSTPLEWKEVRRTLLPQDFNIRTIGARVKKKGDLFKGVFGKGIDMGRSLKALGYA